MSRARIQWQCLRVSLSPGADGKVGGALCRSQPLPAACRRGLEWLGDDPAAVWRVSS